MKLDESYEIKNKEEQSALIDNFEDNEEKKINTEEFINMNFNKDIPSGVSIESASYMESNSNVVHSTTPQQKTHIHNINEEEQGPKLFSDDQIYEDAERKESKEDDHSEKLFDQDTNEDEDFEIPAFLRRQKF